MLPWSSRVVAGVLIAFVTMGCAANAAAAPGTSGASPPLDSSVARAIEQAAFFHNCAADHISVRRLSEDRHSLVLDVCGPIRGYQNIAPQLFGCASAPGPIWIEVPAAY